MKEGKKRREGTRNERKEHERTRMRGRGTKR